MAGLVWGLFCQQGAALFSLLAAGSVATGSRPAPGLRSHGQREMSVSGALSRPKPPEAGAEGQPLQGFAHRHGEMSVSGALSRPKPPEPPEAGAEGQPLQGFAHRHLALTKRSKAGSGPRASRNTPRREERKKRRALLTKKPPYEQTLIKAGLRPPPPAASALTRLRSPTSRADQEIEGRERASSQSQHSPPRGAKKSAAPY